MTYDPQAHYKRAVLRAYLTAIFCIAIGVLSVVSMMMGSR